MTAMVDEHPSAAAAGDRPSLPQRWLIGSIRWYQHVREGRPSPCRFFPSCSAYALEAVEVHGSRRGAWLAVKRLARCRPLGPSGFDPIPEPDAAHQSGAHAPSDSSPDHTADQR